MGSNSATLDIYWNLHRGLWSVRDRRQERVILHQQSLVANDVSFIVQPAGRAKVIATGRKNVHAFVRASSIILTEEFEMSEKNIRIRYNPHKWALFVDDNFEPIYSADHVILTKDGKCYVKK